MRVAAWAAPVEPEAEEKRLERLARTAAAAAAEGARLLVLPEEGALAPSPQGAPSRAAEPSDGPLARALAAIARAHRIALLAGYREACSGRVYSAALLIDAEGIGLANYRRTHLTAAERAAGLAAGAWLSVAALAGHRLGILIGADLHVPEVARALVLSGAEALCVLGARAPQRASLLEPLLAARAIENGVPVVHAGWATADGVGARILAPDGAVRAQAREPGGLAIATLDPPERLRAGLAERRPRLYVSLVAEED
ncbi:MAG: carbon-nitrogen hydrolase family protein [Geminicoccaceae bacterium]|nr:carbon-nitrogen hydrolase family protein [Geminicoccaceae bacterium]